MSSRSSLFLGLTAVLCVAALVLRLFDVSNLGAVIALLAAGVFLMLGLRGTAVSRQARPIELDDEKQATLREMLDRGDEGAAVRQVQLWFRDATPETARAAVQELK